MTTKRESDFIPYKALKTVSKGKTLVFAPHPDDEVFGCGGALIKHIQQGYLVKVIIVTDGGFPVVEQQDIPEYKEIRKEESRKAAKIIGYGEPEFLAYPDGELKNEEKIVLHLLEIIVQFQPQNIYLPAPTEIHPDHLALSKAGTEAARRYAPDLNLFYYEIGQMLSANLLLDITSLHEQLDQAMDCFASQLEVQNYKYHINGLHAYRSYTLGKEVKYAEAYHSINSKSLKTGSELWKQKPVSSGLPDKKELPGEEEYPLISVIVRTMNRPELAEALESISRQTYPNVEVIVVDALGAGTIKPGAKCGNFPIRVICKHKQLPRAEAANAGLHAVKGEYFCFLDEDDLMFNDHIAGLYELLKSNTAPAAYSNIKRVNGKNELLNIFDNDFNFYKLLWNNYIPIHALLYRTEMINSNCLFDEQFEIYEDWDFLLQVSFSGNLIHYNKTTGIYRDIDSSGVQGDFEKINKYRLLIIEKWKDILTNNHYINFLNHLPSLNSNDPAFCISIYCEEKKKLEQALNTMESIKAEKQQIIEENIKMLAEKDMLIANINAQVNEFRTDLNSLTNSRSWRITKPLRMIKKLIFHSVES